MICNKMLWIVWVQAIFAKVLTERLNIKTDSFDRNVRVFWKVARPEVEEE